MNSRTKNVKLNIIYGYAAQVGIIILSFIGRKIFLHFLSADYLGINGLYSNILTILSLAELGLDTAVIYSLYKPIAECDTKLIHSLLIYFRKLYTILAISIFAIGVAIVPFLNYLVKSDLQQKDLVIYYLLFLANSVSSYFVAHKVALLSASQEQRVQKLVTLSFSLVLQIVHIGVLLVWKSYYAYIITTVLNTVMTKIVLGIVADKLHPEVRNETEIVSFDKKPIIERMFSTFLYKIGAVLINSTDNILISVLVSTVAVGYYSNYYTVVSALTGFIAIITTSLIAGVGNLATKGKHKEQSDLFDMMLFFYHTIAAMGLVGFSLLFNHLISVWLGNQYLFDNKTVFVIALNFYISNAISPVWMFREANGLFKKVRYILLVRAALNIVFSIWFGIVWGVFGIFLATAVSLVLTNFWLEPKIVSKEVLHRPLRVYWLKQLKYLLITVVCYAISYSLIKRLGDSILMLAIKALIIIVITGGVFILVNYRTAELKKLRGYLLKK